MSCVRIQKGERKRGREGERERGEGKGRGERRGSAGEWAGAERRAGEWRGEGMGEREVYGRLWRHAARGTQGHTIGGRPRISMGHDPIGMMGRAAQQPMPNGGLCV